MISVLSENFVKVADIKDIQPSQMKEVQVDGEAIGTLDGYEVECPWHGSKFDVRTGEVTKTPATAPESTYVVKVEGNSILIKTINH